MEYQQWFSRFRSRVHSTYHPLLNHVGLGSLGSETGTDAGTSFPQRGTRVAEL